MVVSLPYVLTRPSKQDTDETQRVEYYVKGVVYGLDECAENLREIASEIGAKSMR